MRLVFVNRQGKIMVHGLPKDDVDSCQALLDAFSHENVLQYYKTVRETNISRSLTALDSGLEIVPDYKKNVYLDLVDEIQPDAFKALKYGLCQLVKPYVPEQLYNYLIRNGVVSRFSVIKQNKEAMKELKHRLGLYCGMQYIRQIKPLDGEKATLTAIDYDGNELDQIEVKDGDLILIDKGFEKSGDHWEDFGLLGYGDLTGVDSMEKACIFNADTKDQHAVVEIDPETKYLEIRCLFSLIEAKNDNRASKEYMEELERRIVKDKEE